MVGRNDQHKDITLGSFMVVTVVCRHADALQIKGNIWLNMIFI